MIKAQKFLSDVIRPVLRDMDMWSDGAEKLLLMTACHESGGFRWKKQMGGGPALSWYQIEPATALDVYNNYLAYRPTMRDKLRPYEPESGDIEDALMGDRYATAMCRLIYYRAPERLPDASDDVGLAEYWKKYYNTHLGAGTVDKFLDDWRRYGI